MASIVVPWYIRAAVQKTEQTCLAPNKNDNPPDMR